MKNEKVIKEKEKDSHNVFVDSKYTKKQKYIYSKLISIREIINSFQKTQKKALFEQKDLKVDDSIILNVDDLSVNYNVPKGILRAVKDVSFQVKKGTITSIVGETGSGKSTIASAIIGMLPHATGHVKINNYIIPSTSRFTTKKFRKYLAKTMQFVFQDPFTSMNPKARVRTILREPLRVNNPYLEVKKQKLAILFHEINLEIVKLAEKWSSEDQFELLKLAKSIYHDRKNLVNDYERQIEIDEYSVKNANAQIWQIKNTFKTRLQTFVDAKITIQKKYLNNEEELKILIEQHNKEYHHYKEDLKRQMNLELQNLRRDVKEKKDKLREDKQKVKDILRSINNKKRTFDNIVQKIYRTYKRNKKRVYINTFQRYYPQLIYGQLREKQSLLNYITTIFGDFISSGFFDLLNYWYIVKEVNKIVKYDQEYAIKISSLINNYFEQFSKVAAKHEIDDIVEKNLLQVGLSSKDMLSYPKDFSGGQRQRIAIARAMMTSPELLIADEPISSLDVSIQAQIINLIKDLKDKNNITVVFIAHDLRMVEFLSDSIIVLSKGQIVESGLAKEIFENPTHPYTRSLFSAIPSIDVINKDLDVLEYDPNIYQDPTLELKEFALSETHKVLSTDEWIDDWKSEAKEFVVYKERQV